MRHARHGERGVQLRVVVDAVRVAEEEALHHLQHVRGKAALDRAAHRLEQLLREVQQAEPVALVPLLRDEVGAQMRAPRGVDVRLLAVLLRGVDEFQLQPREVARAQLRQGPGVVRDVYPEGRLPRLGKLHGHGGVEPVAVGVFRHAREDGPRRACVLRRRAHVGAIIEAVAAEAQGQEYEEQQPGRAAVFPKQQRARKREQRRKRGGVQRPALGQDVLGEGAAAGKGKARPGQIAHTLASLSRAAPMISHFMPRFHKITQKPRPRRKKAAAKAAAWEALTKKTPEQSGLCSGVAPLARLERTTFRLGGGPSILVRYRGLGL